MKTLTNNPDQLTLDKFTYVDLINVGQQGESGVHGLIELRSDVLAGMAHSGSLPWRIDIRSKLVTRYARQILYCQNAISWHSSSRNPPRNGSL